MKLKLNNGQIVAASLCAGFLASMLISNVRLYNTSSNLRKEVKSYQQQVDSLEINVSYFKDMVKSRDKELSKFTNPIQYSAAEMPIYDIPLSEELQRYTYERCVFYNCVEHYEIVLAIMWQESNYRPDLISSTDDYGIMQINKCNHEFLKKNLGIVDMLDAKDNIDAGTYIISCLLSKYETPHEALMAYNMGSVGAAKCWDRGIYTSFYSESVIEKAKLILSDEYR